MNGVERIDGKMRTIITSIIKNIISRILSRRKPGTESIARSIQKRLMPILESIKGLMRLLERRGRYMIVNTGNFIQSRMHRISITVVLGYSKQEDLSPPESGRSFVNTTTIHAFAVGNVNQK